MFLIFNDTFHLELNFMQTSIDTLWQQPMKLQLVTCRLMQLDAAAE